jgi:lipopolysaccharide/colanic/teichoic acid biosynthesis glycosyltransferase
MAVIYRNIGKRAFDVVLSVLVLILLAPVLVVAALAIKATSRGPIFYTQERVGRGGRPFRFIKFRTMVVGAEKMGAGALCLQNDPRVSAIGRWLRRFSLDELPQVFNVLRGEMSVIGPRPGLDYQAREYTPEQRRRLTVLPGITGWAQVNGRNSLSWDERIRLDLEYIDRMSFVLDLRILIRTAKTVLGGGDMLAARDYFKDKALGTRDGR